MGSDEVSILVATVVALVLLVLYAAAGRRELGRNPFWAAEVYLYVPPGAGEDTTAAAAALAASVASVAQVRAYLAMGGSARGYGYAAGPNGLVAVGASASASAGIGPDVGVWLYGAKPPRGARGVAPFDRGHWFQPP
jgi:hypothetical protein